LQKNDSPRRKKVRVSKNYMARKAKERGAEVYFTIKHQEGKRVPRNPKSPRGKTNYAGDAGIKEKPNTHGKRGGSGKG